jgi:hypothetical protein
VETLAVGKKRPGSGLVFVGFARCMEMEANDSEKLEHGRFVLRIDEDGI